MKVLYDHQIFAFQNYGGISRYFIELMNNFYRGKEVNFELSLMHSDNQYLKNSEFYSNSTLLSNKYMPFKKKIKKSLNKYKTISAFKKQNFNVFHPTYYETYFLEYIGKKPFILTVCDMIHELFPDLFSKDPTSINKRGLIEKASKIIAISKNTKKDIIKFYGINEDKIEVIYLANSFNTGIKMKESFNLPKKFVLFLGTRWPYKNFKFFIKSIAPLILEDNDLNVICAGGMAFTNEEKEILSNLNIADRVFHYPITDDLLAYLYQNALAFVFPSLYEGFGIPVLESFNCGCPLIVSKTSSLPEVAGDATVYINPEDKNSIKNAIEKVIYNEDLRQELINKGYEQAKKFSWEKTAQQTKLVYESVL